MEFAKANTTANLDFAQELFGAKSPTEALELWTGHARKQWEAFGGQAKELVELVQRVAPARPPSRSRRLPRSTTKPAA